MKIDPINEIDALLAELGYVPSTPKPEPEPESEQPEAAEPPSEPLLSEEELPSFFPETGQFPEKPKLNHAASKVVLQMEPKETPKLDVPLEEEPSGLWGRICAALDADMQTLSALTDRQEQALEEAPIDLGGIRRILFFCLGLFFLIMAAVGLWVTGSGIVRRAERFLTNADQKETFLSYLLPAIIMDIPSFEDVSQLTNEQLVTAAVWQCMINDDFSDYQQSGDVAIVPAATIQEYAQNLFGSDITLTPVSVLIGDTRCYYNEELQSYHVPLSVSFFSCDPVVKTMSKHEEQYEITVDYYREAAVWQTRSASYEPELSKSVLFTVKAVDGALCIVSAEQLADSVDSGN